MTDQRTGHRFAPEAVLELVAAASALVPTCEETTYDEAADEGHACGKRATHMDRMNGIETNHLCDVHAELALASVKKAESKGYSRARELDAPRPLDPDARIDRLAETLEGVKVTLR